MENQEAAPDNTQHQSAANLEIEPEDGRPSLFISLCPRYKICVPNKISKTNKQKTLKVVPAAYPVPRLNMYLPLLYRPSTGCWIAGGVPGHKLITHWDASI